MNKKTILYTLIILSLLGLAASIYLAHLHYKMADSFCDFNEQFSCSSINKSAYAKIFGVPVSVLGIFGYTFFALVPLFLLLNFNFRKLYDKLTIPFITKSYFLIASGSFIFSLYLTYLELNTINVICPLCLVSQIIVIFILFFSYIIYNKTKGLLK